MRVLQGSNFQPRLTNIFRHSLAMCAVRIALFWLVAVSGAGMSDEVKFNHHIRPILAEYCFQCHGPDASKRQGDLRLDLESSAKEHAIVGTVQSDVFQRIISKDADSRMPPPATGKQLSSQEVDLVRQWLEQGAHYEGHWAFEPIHKPEVPPLPDAAKNAAIDASTRFSEIDRFVLKAQESRGLSLSSRISRQQWIRRAYIDLTGLPPTWEEVDSFVNDKSNEAYSRLLDRLLDSPAYGQRWGRHWLDIARYADTHGGSAIGFTSFPFSYTYRDYVVRAFNDDLPYDRFVVEQIAADQLGLQKNDPALAALGFLTVGMQYRNHHDVIDDQIDVVTRGLMGLTVACARCHDHKFDAISTKDYYALYATLASSSVPEALPIVGEVAETPSAIEYQRSLGDLQIQYDDMGRDQSEVMRSRLRSQIGLYLREIAKGTPEQDLSTSFLSYRTDDVRPLVLNRWRSYLASLREDDPVFGPWLSLSGMSASSFKSLAADWIQSRMNENQATIKPAEMHSLRAKPPKWNPRILESIYKKQPQSMAEVADAYGELFVEVQQEWLQALQQSSLEAVSQESVVPDEDPKHAMVNSPVHRQLRRHLYGEETPTNFPNEVAVRLLNRTISDALGGKRGAIHELHLSASGSPPRAMVLRESTQPRDFFVFLRGNPLTRGDRVQPRFLSALSPNNKGQHESQPYLDGKRRLGLAQSTVARDNPLTRRVIVNWVWQHHFGEGLVRTADDFGTRGRPPTHPELLDYLAETLYEDGWSLKKLHRRIMLSDVYQQGSVESEKSRSIDAENDFLWRMPRRRLDLESMRDAMLAVSGELDATLGGRPFDMNTNPAIPRRSIYGFINRDIVSNLASTFDGANPNACTVKRPDTTVPQQSLFALNSEFIQDRALQLEKLSKEAAGDDDSQRVVWLYRRLFSRTPEPDEKEIAIQFVQSSRLIAKSGTASASSWQLLAHALLASNEFIFID
jgi:hypothetical protein